MADEPRNTPNPFEIFGSNTGNVPDQFDIFDTYQRPPTQDNTSEQLGTDKVNDRSLPIFGLATNNFTPEENDWIDSVIAAPRGVLRGAARTIPLLGEGVWGILDLATNLSGKEDWLNPRESAFIARMDELRDAIGYEDSVAGRTGEALGSILGFVGSTILTGGAGAASRVGAGYNALKAGELTAGAATKSLASAMQIAAPGSAIGVGEASGRMREYEAEIGEDLSIADRNLATALAIPLGATEVLPIVRPLSILFSKITKRGLPKETIDSYMDLAKSAAITGTAEGVQEALASIGQDAIEKGVYNESATIGDSIASEFGYGGGAGAIFDLGVNLLTKGRPRGGRPVGPVEDDTGGLSGTEATEVEDASTLDEGRPNTVAQFQGSEEIVLDNEFEVPKDAEGDAVIPPDVKVDDEVDMYDALGNSYKARVTAVSDSGSIKIINQQGEEVVANMSPTATTSNVNNPNYEFKTVSPAFKKSVNNKKNVSELNEQEIAAAQLALEARIEEAGIQLIGLDALQDLNALKLHQKRRQQPLDTTVENQTKLGPQQEIEAQAQAFKDEVPTIPDAEEQIKTEAVRQQLQEVSPELQANLDQEVELERQIQQAEDADNLNEADDLKEKINQVKDKQTELIKKQKTPIRRSRLIQTFNRPDGETFTARFPDRESVDAFSNKNVVKTKNKLNLTTPAYNQFKTKYDSYVAEEVNSAYKSDTREFKLQSFRDFVAQEQGSVQVGDILSQTTLKNIDPNDAAFKRFLYLNTKKRNLKDLNGLQRKEIFRQIEALPTQTAVNTSIDKAFSESIDNRQAFSKAEAIKARTKELENKYTKAQLLDLAKTNGVSEEFIQDAVGTRDKTTIAKGIARKEIQNQISAEENYEQVVSRSVPNVQVRKVKTKAADQARGFQQYSVLYPDDTIIKTLVPANIDVADAKEQAARQTFTQRVERLEEENIKTKDVPDASQQDYIQAVTNSLFKRTNPLAELLSIAGPQVKQSRTPAIQTEQVQDLIEEAPQLEAPDLSGINYQGNLYKFKDNINASDFIMNLRRIAKRTMPDADVVAVDTLFNESGEEVAGVTIGDIIAINLETNPENGRPRFASPTDTVYHEAVHYFINNNYFKPEVLQILAENQQRIFDIAETRFGGKVGTFEEAVAIASGYYNEQKLQGRTPFEFTPGIRRVFEPLFKFFNQVAKYFSGKKYRKLEDVFDAIRTGDLYQDAVDNPKILSPPQQQFQEELFKQTGYVGSYKGGSITEDMNLDYDSNRNMTPLYSRTPSFGLQELKISEMGQRIDRLQDAVNNTKTKSTKADKWLTTNKQGQELLTGSNVPFNKLYLQDTRLDEWLSEQVNEDGNPREVSIDEIKNYLKTNTGFISMQMTGGDTTTYVRATNINEQQTIEYYQNEILNSTIALNQFTSGVQSHLVNRDDTYKALKEEFYTGPDDQGSGAFYDLTRNLDQIEESYKKLNLSMKQPIGRNFDVLRQALNVETKSPDFLFSDAKAGEIETAINQLTVSGQLLQNTDALRKADPDGHLEKFLVALENNKIVSDPIIEILDEINTDSFDGGNRYNKLDLQDNKLTQLVNARNQAKRQNEYFTRLLYGEGTTGELNPVIRSSFESAGYATTPGFNIDTTSGKFTDIQRLAFQAIKDGNPNKSEGQIIQERLQGIPQEVANFTEDQLAEFTRRRRFDGEDYGTTVHVENSRNVVYAWNPGASQEQKGYYSNPHFPNSIRNAFVHARIKDVYVLDDNNTLKKILFIDEVQSDMYADVKKAIDKYLNELNDGDPRKEGGASSLTEAEVKEALEGYPTTQDMPAVPLIGFPKPNFNKWQDFIIEEMNMLAVNEGFDGIAIASTAIQAERNGNNLKNNFNFLSFYPSVKPSDISTNLSTELTHTPSGQTVEESTLLQQGYLTQEELNQDDPVTPKFIRSAAAQYFGDVFSRDTNSYEFKTYVNYARLVGMTDGFITKDMTLSLQESNPIRGHFVDGVNYLGRGIGETQVGSVSSILPNDLADLIIGQIQNGIRSNMQRPDINVITQQEARQDQNNNLTIDTSRLLRNAGNQSAIGAGYINLRKLTDNQTQQFFSKSGWDIYSNTYPNKIKKSLDKLGIKYETQGQSVKEIIQDIFGADSDVTINNVVDRDFHSNRLYQAPYDELVEQEQFTVDEVIFRTKSEIDARKGKPLLLQTAFKDNARLLYRGEPAKKHQSRFNVPVFTFESDAQVVNNPAKYSSTPADAQKASYWKRIVNFLGNLTESKYFSGLGNLEQRKEYQRLKGLTAGEINKAEKVAKDFYNDLGQYLNPRKSQKTKEELNRNVQQFNAFIEGGMDADPALITDEGLRKVAVKSKQAIDRIGQMLVQRGVLPRSKFEENRGTYLPLLYMKHILNNPTGTKFSYTKARKDLTDETKLILGDITELSPEYRVLAGVQRPLRDMAILDFFNQVSKNQNWAIRNDDMLVTIEQGGVEQKVSALWLLEEAKRLQEQATYFENGQPEQALAMRNLAQQYEQLGMPVAERLGYGADKPLDENFKRLPTTKQYGMMRGVAVRKEIYDDVIGTFTMGDTDNAFSKTIAALEKGTSIWKLLKVPLNPPTVVRNVGSNMILMNIVGGVPIHKVLPRMRQAIEQIRSNGKYWKIAEDYGIQNTQFTNQEMLQISEEYLDLLQEVDPLGPVAKFFRLPKLLTARVFKTAGDVYQFTESVGKTAVIIDAMERQGMSEFDAFQLAQKALFDYSDVPMAGKLFRKAPIGMPFFTFYYKAFPALVEAAINHPFRYAPYVALSAGLTALSAYAFGFEDDEEEKLQKGLEPWLAKRTGVYVLPFKDSDGRYQFLDIGYFFPWTMYTDAVRDIAGGDFFEAQRTTGFLSGPFSDIFLAIKTNKDPFTQRTIWDKRDPVEDRIQNMFWYMYSLGMPSWLTPNGAISKTTKALQDIPRPTGAPADTVPQALLRFVGVNVYGLDTEETRIRNIKKMRQEILDIQQRFKYAMANQSYTQEKKDRLRQRYMQMIKEKVDLLQRYKIDTAIPRHILERESKFQDG